MDFHNDAPAQTKDTPNWVAKFIFNKSKNMIERTYKQKDESVLIMMGNIPQVKEFEKDRILIVASQSVLLFENWKCIREYKEHNPTNYYTMTVN